MQVTNRCSFAVIGFGWDERFGYGDDVNIKPGETKDVFGPHIGEMGGKSCNLVLPGDLIVHEGADDEEMHKFQVLPENLLAMNISETSGITIRHFEDERDV